MLMSSVSLSLGPTGSEQAWKLRIVLPAIDNTAVVTTETVHILIADTSGDQVCNDLQLLL